MGGFLSFSSLFRCFKYFHDKLWGKIPGSYIGCPIIYKTNLAKTSEASHLIGNIFHFCRCFLSIISFNANGFSE